MPRIPTKPDTLKRLQKRARNTTHGAPKGEWSGAKAALARIAYEKQGGEWKETDKATDKRRALDARRRRQGKS